MANIINKSNHLYEELRGYKKKQRISILFLIISLIGFNRCFYIMMSGGTNDIWISFVSKLYPILMILIIISPIFINLYGKKVKILKSGLEGEVKSKKVFSRLSDDYYVLSDLDVKVDDKLSQVDSTVVGSNGIFVIETKNLNGTIIGDEKDHEIVQQKIGANGRAYSKKFYNPIKQVNTHVYRVSEVLKKYNLNIWVQGVVYFTNNNCVVDINSTRIPVFSTSEEGDKEILNYIVNYSNNGKDISQEDKIKIVNILKEFLIDEVIRSNKGIRSKISNTMSNSHSEFNENCLRFQQEMIDRELMEFSRKSITSFDEGGFVQGEGFNLSDTMAEESFRMNNMSDNF